MASDSRQKGYGWQEQLTAFIDQLGATVFSELGYAGTIVSLKVGKGSLHD